MDGEVIDGDAALLALVLLAGLIPVAADAAHARTFGLESVIGTFTVIVAAAGLFQRVRQRWRARRIRRDLLK